jgi:hypothetical protein
VCAQASGGQLDTQVAKALPSQPLSANSLGMPLSSPPNDPLPVVSVAGNRRKRQEVLIASLARLTAAALARPDTSVKSELTVKSYAKKATVKTATVNDKKGSKKAKKGRKKTPRSLANKKYSEPQGSDYDEYTDSEGDDADWLNAIASFMKVDSASVALVCPDLGASMVGEYVVYCQADGIHFMQISSHYDPEFRNTYNFEITFLIGEDAGKKMNYALRAEAYSAKPSNAVGNWGVVMLG